MRSLLVLVYLICSATSIYAQGKALKVGDKAPKINITQYLLNAPANQDLSGKFIILEFWATWCAPCIDAVPHINYLQKKFSNEKDLVFLSITNESEEVAKRVLNRVPFTTVVVSDQTKETEIGFKVSSLPHTVLVDNKGVVKWIGDPRGLNDSLISQFVKGANLEPQKVESQDTQALSSGTSRSNKLIDNAMVIFNDQNSRYLFYFAEETRTDNRRSFVYDLGSGKCVDMNKSLAYLLAKMNNKSELMVIVPDSFQNKTFTVIYRNQHKISGFRHRALITNGILNYAGLTESTETRNTEVYDLEVVDAKLLPISENQFTTQRENSSDQFFGIRNSKMEVLIKMLSERYRIIIHDATSVSSGLDFLVRSQNLEATMEDLKKYGLKLTKTRKDLAFTVYK